ncbi:MAG: glycoside hydrolase family 130 protein [Bacteroidota bacterium]|nr:glycoside hydrolase family 130 protein [Bacteroidota bacterium]MDP4225208.1 glycoside hydrolase family 130 protein [Bacteroidota bacterium]MDP4272857.1 glycoside hydrolase family 130 protein [Bacteroidota bacterium]
MKIPVERKDIKFYPDCKRVIARFLNYGDTRTKTLIKRVYALSEKDAKATLSQTLREFTKRHRNITRIFENHYEKIKYLMEELSIDDATLSMHKKLLIGAYCTMEYSVESAALFNPSIIEDPDQSDLEEGQKRVILSFRAVGEGHISSLVFRSGIIDKYNNLSFLESGTMVEEAVMIKQHQYNKELFEKKLNKIQHIEEIGNRVSELLKEDFTYLDLKNAMREILFTTNLDPQQKDTLRKIVWLADLHYNVQFSLDTDLSERVIYPVAESENKGIEDARFVLFQDEEGHNSYYATYTAFDGYKIGPKLLHTHDFYTFESMPLHGDGAQNKDLALFPRKINGKYAMVARVDGINTYIMYSDTITIWENPIKIQEPRYPWEYVQVGNCGSPMETEKGWLIITHGVGPMRRYCLGASLFDLIDPTKEIGRLKEPLLAANIAEREGYVPNVVYSCGSMIHNNQVIIPYAMSDFASSFITVPLDKLLKKLINGD